MPYVKYHLFRSVFAEHIAALGPDIVHAHDLLCVPAAAQACAATGARLVYDAHELEMHRNPPLSFLQKRWVSRLERRYSRCAQAVIAVGRYGAMVLEEHLGRPVHVIYNSPLLDPCRRHIREDCRLDDTTRLIVYVGKITEGRGISDVIAMLPRLPNVAFAAVGPVAPRSLPRIVRIAERLGVRDRFYVLPPVPFEQVTAYITGADLGMISVEPVTLSYRYCMPNKLFEMSFAKIPILSNELDEIRDFLTEIGNGEVLDFEQTEIMPLAIYRLLNAPRENFYSKEGWEKLMATYSWQSQAEKLDRIYRDILGAGHGTGVRETAV
jgi:glycosyltransferase involved in cell wall biosynthesis